MVMKMIMGEESIQLLHVLVVVLLLYGNTPALGVSSEAKISCVEREKQALLKFKQTLEYHYGMLSSWGNEEDKRDCCKWRGVRCNNRTGHVTKLDLQGSKWENPYQNLAGKISPSLRELHHLKYLDLSGNDFWLNEFPDFITSFNRLQYLNLRGSLFSGPFPHQLGNLSNLRYLALGSNGVFSSRNDLLDGGNLEWLSRLSVLEHLDLSGMNLSQATNWVKTINNLPLLENLSLYQCNLPNAIPPARPFNSSRSIDFLDLSSNALSPTIYNWLFNLSSSLVYQSLDRNLLNGPFPDSFGNMISLVHLSLRDSHLEGAIPKSFSNLSHLQSLEVSYNDLSGELPEFAQKSLQVLDLSANQLTGAIPESFGQLLSLTRLDLGYNKLNGSVTRSIGGLSKLEYFDMSSNAFEGMISEEHFSNLSNLKHLDLSFNPLLVLNISYGWVPPFQLDIIQLSSCKLGPHFPKWLQNQNNFSELDISGAGISDVVPIWFWNLPTSLSYLNLSCNQMNGLVPNLSLMFYDYPSIDLSSNRFTGHVPQFPSNVTFLYLSENMFSGSISSMCPSTSVALIELDLSSNRLFGGLPDCWEWLKSLSIIKLANNNLSGKLPNSMGSLENLQVLQLRNNSFHGELPTSLKNCEKLMFIDLGWNKFTGKIQAWIGMHLTGLVVLALRSNKFYGGIPQNLCHLNYIRVLDFSQNDLSGKLPLCFDNFSALVEIDKNASDFTFNSNYGTWSVSGTYEGNALLQWKGKEREYTNILAQLKIIDLSSNKFDGEIPKQVSTLEGLVSLNLSSNNLTGKIIQEIGQMKMLESLDLSGNRLSGEIPTSLARLNYLSMLDLSNNNLSGRIPIGTQLQGFNASAYSGNPQLCGLPLSNNCTEEETDKRIQEEEEQEEDRVITSWFYISMGLGFTVGFFAVFGTMLFSSSSRYAYFKLLDSIHDWLYVTIAVNIARLQRRCRAN